MYWRPLIRETSGNAQIRIARNLADSVFGDRIATRYRVMKDPASDVKCEVWPSPSLRRRHREATIEDAFVSRLGRIRGLFTALICPRSVSRTDSSAFLRWLQKASISAAMRIVQFVAPLTRRRSRTFWIRCNLISETVNLLAFDANPQSSI